MFRPRYLSFAGTYQCNLTCPHCCVPIEWPERLDIGVAVRFLEDAHAQGIGILGFTGGEPFIYSELLLFLLVRADARPGGKHAGRRRADRRLDRAAAELRGRGD